MNRPNIAGIPLEQFKAPIIDSLRAYSLLSRGDLEFRLDEAADLNLTPDLAQAARSLSTVKILGGDAMQLIVIAFKPGDGTGSEVKYKLADLDTDPFPAIPRVVPRPKTGFFEEVHISLASHLIDEPLATPRLFAGNYQLLGLDGRRVSRIGTLGQTEAEYDDIMTSGDEARRNATRTVVYRRVADQLKQYGNPHAVYTPVRVEEAPQTVQVCGFLAVKDTDPAIYQLASLSLRARAFVDLAA